MSKRKKTEYLTNRDRRILAFVDRYRVGTNRLFASALLGGPDEEDNAGRTVRKLVRRGLLQKVNTTPNESYVVLTRRGCRVISVPDRTPRPLTEQSLPVVLAIASFCVRARLTRLTDREFRRKFPELWRPGLRSSIYYLLETTDGMNLAMFLVDRGGTARRINAKIRRLVAQRASLPAFESLIGAGRFRVTVLTGLPASKQNIRRRFRRLKYDRVQVDVAVVPELGEWLTQR